MHHLYQFLKNIYHYIQAHLWRTWYGFPDKNLSLYGITGTNGKTTTCFLTAGILSAAHGADKVGMLTTIAVRMGMQEQVNETKLTTLPSRLVYSYLRKMKQAGVQHVVLEMTSHALDQNRLAGIKLDGAIITNIEREHLNYHRTMERYTKAKMRIVEYLKPNAPVVVKKDDEWIARGLAKIPSTGFKKIFFSSAEAVEIQTPLHGRVNQENALAASRLTSALGITKDVIQQGIASVTHVAGRMEEVSNEKGIRIVIDYAVTPAALEKLYKDVRSNASGKVLALLGAAGLRDRGKRPDMAKTVAKYADVLVITREDPWTEPEEQIFEDLEQGLQGIDINWRRIVDRKEAIRFLLEQAQAGDSVIITGKGAETGMGIGKKIVPWNDRQVIEELLE